MKKGFTLVELLVIVAILGMLVMVTVPNVIDSYNVSIKKDMEMQEKYVSDAGVIFIRDACYNPINSDYKARCSEYFKNVNVGGVEYRRLLLSDLQYFGYMDAVMFKDVSCNGVVLFEKNDNGRFDKNPKTYLKCGDAYVTDSSFSYSLFGL